MEERRSLLAPREWDVVECVAEGMTTEEIAKTLYLAPGTVDVIVSNIYKKLGINSRLKLAVMYYKGQLGERPPKREDNDE